MKFKVAQREQIKNIVATLSLKRLSDKEIIKEIELLTGNQVSREYIYKVKQLIKKARPLIGINSKFDKLITALRTAVSDDSGRLDKESTSYDDVLYSWRLALKHFRVKNKNKEKPIILLHE